MMPMPTNGCTSMERTAESVSFRFSTVLVVDDNDFFRNLIETMLRALDVGTIQITDCAEKAIAELSKRQFDCVVTDWAMGSMDGLGLVRRIRTSDKIKKSDVPIIMCSAYTELERVIAARDAGVTEFLAKPISAAHLHDKLANALFADRAFISDENYIGPDRRRRKEQYSGPERRSKLSQESIDSVMQDGAA